MELEEKEFKRAKNAAYRFLTIRFRSRAEVNRKLHDKSFSPSVIAAVVEHLLDLGYLDDRKFACQWAASRAKLRGYGRRRIEQELKQKGIDQETIREALNEAVPSEGELTNARTVAEKKLKAMKGLGPEARKRRLAGFLERKGFSSDIIYPILKTL